MAKAKKPAAKNSKSATKAVASKSKAHRKAKDEAASQQADAMELDDFITSDDPAVARAQSAEGAAKIAKAREEDDHVTDRK
jgi:hypothetical protein